MLRRFLRATAAWAGILPAQQPEEREPRLFSTDVGGKPGAGRGRMEATLKRITDAKVPRAAVAADGAVATMDAEICKGGAAFGDLDPDAALTDALLGWFASQQFIGYQMAALLAQHWLIDKACSMPARDAVRHGFAIELKGLEGDPDNDTVNGIRDDISRADKRFQLRHHLQDFVRSGRIFGVRLALFAVDLGSEQANKDYYENPFNPDAVKPDSYRGIRQIDQYWVSPLLDNENASNPLSPGFYEPTWWMIGGWKIHRSHFAIFRATEVPDNLKPYYLYGGVPLPQRIMERVYAAERSANEGPLLLMSKRLYVWKTALEDAMTDPGKFLEHLAAVYNLQNNFGFKVVDTDDDMQSFDTALADVDAVISSQYQLVAAIANVPATKLLGTTPKGFQSTGEFESKSYHEELETIQENDLSPLVDRHHHMVLLSELPDLAADKVTILHTWAPVDSPSGKDYAEINKLNAEADAALVNAGVLDPEDVRDRLRNDPNSGHAGLPEDPAPVPPQDDPPAGSTPGEPDGQSA